MKRRPAEWGLWNSPSWLLLLLLFQTPGSLAARLPRDQVCEVTLQDTKQGLLGPSTLRIQVPRTPKHPEFLETLSRRTHRILLQVDSLGRVRVDVERFGQRLPEPFRLKLSEHSTQVRGTLKTLGAPSEKLLVTCHPWKPRKPSLKDSAS
jgi:hypothetical protein